MDSKSCGIPTHATRKFRASSEHVHILETENKALCEPHLGIRVLEDKQLALLLSKRFTKEEWIMLFGAMEQGSYPDWLIAAAPLPTFLIVMLGMLETFLVYVRLNRRVLGRVYLTSSLHYLMMRKTRI